ncbi:MAG: hypothetical protein K2P67_05765 [Gallionellaceae bacterium]|jgi:hypothetical protein|nr:hypothetical protein [Gallionellaceae bacterium]
MTGGKIEIEREGEVDFAKPLPRALLRDSRLSFGARGLFAFLWDLPRGWIIRLVHLISMAPEGRDALRSRLHELEAVGALRIEPIRVEGGKVAGKRWVLVSADRWAIEHPLSQENSSDYTEERISRSSVNPIIGNSASKVLQGSKVLQEEAAAPRAHARGTDSAAAPALKIFNRRQSGIVTWLPADVQAAEALEQQHAPDDIAAAVAALRAVSKQPVPGLIQQQIEQLQRDRQATQCREQEDATMRKRDADSIDPAWQAKGEELLLRVRIKNKSDHRSAT